MAEDAQSGEDPRRSADIAPEELPDEVRSAALRALERKALDVCVLDLRGLTSATDFFVLATGRSRQHVESIAEHVLDAARSEGNRPGHLEGMRDRRWVLIDHITHVVHVFHRSLREFYQLERLWGDAPVIRFEDAPSHP